MITVPAYFGDSHRAATVNAARLAGIPLIEPLIDEPSAAALAFARYVEISRGEPVLVVDWGGGTLDVTVLMNDGRAWVQLRIDGDLNLGGDDIDLALAGLALRRRGYPDALLGRNETLFPLIDAARKAKELLSSNTSAQFICPIRNPENLKTSVITDRLTREDFDEVAGGLVDKAIEVVKRCLDHPDVPLKKIHKILLAGGSTIIPSFRRKLSALLPDARLCDEVNPMDVVALGAAIYAEMEAEDLIRMCPYGYSIKDRDGELIEVIPPDQEIPTPEDLPYGIPRDHELMTSYDGQTVYRLALYPFKQLDRGLKELLGGGGVRVFGRNFPPRPAGSKVEFHLWLDVNKIVRARVRLEGTEETREMEQISGAEVGPQALATELKDCCLGVEALLEHNAGNEGPLLQRLRAEWGKANELLDAHKPEEMEAALNTIRQLIEQISQPHTRTRSDEDERNRVLGWVFFIEQDLLPKYWPLLDDDERESSVETIRRIRIMDQTGAPVGELAATLREFKEKLTNMPVGPVLAGYYESNVHGVPKRISDELRKLCDDAAGHYASGNQFEFRQVCASIDSRVKEAGESWVAWSETAGVEIVSPELVVK